MTDKAKNLIRRAAILLCALLFPTPSLAAAPLTLRAEGFPVSLPRGEAARGALSVTGGRAPYAVEVGGVAFTLDMAGQIDLRWPTGAETGEKMTLGLAVTDAKGNEAACALEIALRDEVPLAAVRATGDEGLDVMLAAVGELGYTPRADGYTKYGAWVGDPYAPANAAFVSYCLESAGVGADVLPRAETAAAWIRALGRDLLPAGGYAPRHGDVAFVAGETGEGPRVGVVSHVWDRTISIIALTKDGVTDQGYALEDGGIIGYIDVAAALARAETAETEATDIAEEEAPSPEPYWEDFDAVTNVDLVPVRNEPAGEVVGVIETAGAIVHVTGRAGLAGGAAWYAVKAGSLQGYARADQLSADRPYEPRYGRTLGGGVTAREAPDVEKSEVARFDQPGTKMQVTGRAQGADRYVWFEVIVDGQKAYVRGDLFEPYPEAEPAIDDPSGERAEIRDGRLIIFALANPSGTAVTGVEIYDKWERE